MEKGTLRVDANVSVRPAGSDELRTRCEIKNMNSFNYIARGIDAEIARQIEIWESGGEVEQETYDFDAAIGHADAAAREGGGGRLPLLPRARSRSGRAAGRAGRAAARRAARAARRPDPAGRGRGSISSGRSSSSPVGSTRSARRPWRRAPTRSRRATSSPTTSSGAGVEPGARRRATAGEARRGAGADPAAGLRRGDRARRPTPGFTAEPYLAQEAVSDTAALEPIIDAILAANPGAGRAVPGRQGGAARLLRRSGDEGDEGPGGRSRGQRARPGEALGVDNRSTGALRSALCPSRQRPGSASRSYVLLRATTRCRSRRSAGRSRRSASTIS